MNNGKPNIPGGPIKLPPLTDLIASKEARQIQCKCGCKTFLQVQTFWFVSPVAPSNPTGEEIVGNHPGWMCTGCKTFYSDPPPNLPIGRKS